ncbi:MAG TPA: hypothetical protein VKB88_09705 [Bryobacteraceae bacterium]|nr:hypothetical protein [Bryobacteraceae bacterium]
MHHGEGQGEIDGAGKIRQAKRLGRGQARVDPVTNTGFRRTPPKPCQHPGLDVHCDHATGAAHASGHVQSEESHSGAGFEDGHA